MTMQWKPRAQRGQALVLAVICMLVFVIGVLVLFNTGQIVNKKVQLNNTADAAAYSAAVQQARAYNVVAYLNRAQVANEIATAQMVSIHSWMNFAISATNNFAKAVQAIGVGLDITVVAAEVGVELNEIATELNQLKGTLQELRDVMKPTFTAFITGLSLANVAYADTTRAVTAAEVLDIPSLVETVVEQNSVTAEGSTDKVAKLNAKSSILLHTQAVTANQSYVKLYQVPFSRSSSSNACGSSAPLRRSISYAVPEKHRSWAACPPELQRRREPAPPRREADPRGRSASPTSTPATAPRCCAIRACGTTACGRDC